MQPDLLSPVLAHFSARAKVFHTGNLCHREVFDLAGQTGFLHLLRSGRMQLRDSSGHVADFVQPTLVFYARPQTHWIDATVAGGADLACATVEFDHQAFNPIALALPPRFVCGLHELEASRGLLDMLFAEAFTNQPARTEVLNRLFELVLIHLLRIFVARGGGDACFLRGLAHPKLSKALAALHADPSKPWLLATLAQQAAMSRSSFAEIFHREVGRTPGEYLTRWRLTVAQALLRRGMSLKHVGEHVGYASHAGFLRAFKQVLGVSPTEWLRSVDVPVHAPAQATAGHTI